MSLMKLLKFKTWETGAFQYASFGNASFPNGNEDYSCLWAMFGNILTLWFEVDG